MGPTPERGRAVDLFQFAKVLFALVATLALIAGVAWVARRFGMVRAGGASERRLQVSESLMLDPRRRLVIVRCDGREHVLLLSPMGDRIVAHMDARAEAGT
jgi:flagellar protein FliO/FliZ